MPSPSQDTIDSVYYLAKATGDINSVLASAFVAVGQSEEQAIETATSILGPFVQLATLVPIYVVYDALRAEGESFEGCQARLGPLFEGVMSQAKAPVVQRILMETLFGDEGTTDLLSQLGVEVTA